MSDQKLKTEDSYLVALKQAIDSFKTEYKVEDEGIVVSYFDGIVKAIGLKNAFSMEVVTFESGCTGIVLNLNESSVDIMLLDSSAVVQEGEKISLTRKKSSIPVGMGMLGRVVNVLGQPIDGAGKIESDQLYDVEREVPSIMNRKSIFEPLETGILAIDSAIPIGRGQRELIIGDRQTGKTSIALDTIVNQGLLNKKREKKDKVYSVYVSIGQKRSTIANIIEKMKEKGVMDDCIFVVASASDSAAMQFLAPYAGCAIAEYFRDNGMHSLIVYDDLSKHAFAYREISLLLRRPPAREAYPGDIFYLHSRLLERAAKLSDESGGGSLTALPIIETQAGDISAYIPTNVVSITDGQIFLESDLFYQGIRPAINVGLSVSRVGSAAQSKPIKELAGKLKTQLAQYRELEAFSKFSSDLDEATLQILRSGKRIVSLLVQNNFDPLSIEEEIVLLFIIKNDLLLELDVITIKKFTKDFLFFISEKHRSLVDDIMVNGFKKNQEQFLKIFQDFEYIFNK